MDGLAQRATALAWFAAAAAIAALPYLFYTVQYGSPTPSIPGQIDMLRSAAHREGWDGLPPLGPLEFARFFISSFVREWMPGLGDQRSAVNVAALAIPSATLLAAFAGAAVSATRLWRRCESPLDLMVAAIVAAFVVAFSLHIVFSYHHQVATGWRMEAYPRYYLPVAAMVPLCCLALVTAVKSPRLRTILLTVLIAGPVAFRLFGGTP